MPRGRRAGAPRRPHRRGAGALLVLCALLCAAPGVGRAAGPSQEVELAPGARLRATLLADVDETRGPVAAGVLFDLDPGWHLYWHHPGDSGLAPRIALAFPGSETRAGEIAWPAPRAFHEDETIVTYGYQDRVLLAAPIEQAGDVPPARVTAQVEALVCATQCVPASFSLSRSLHVASPAARARTRTLFETFAARVPGSAAERRLRIEPVGARHVAGPPERFIATFRIQGCGDAQARCALARPGAGAAFHPAVPEAWQIRVAATERDLTQPHAWRITLRGTRNGDAEPGLPRLRGVLVESGEGAAPAVELGVPLAEAVARGEPDPVREALTAGVLLRALGAGLLGGLILNLMPCVLPVLALKLFALAEQSRRSRREVLANAGAYTTGILATLLALAAAVIALRTAGQAVGWGFHLQEPVFVAGVAAVVVAFALNLLGVFEVDVDTTRLAGVGARSTGVRRSFFDGLLAVVLATPCSAPFLGTAVGVAFASPAPVIVMVFAAVGLGLAAPFVAVALLPAGVRLLPRPGPWMLALRRSLGFVLLGTAVWLLWVVGRASGVDAMAALLCVLLALAVCGDLLGRLQRAGRRTPAWAVLAVLGLVFATGLNLVSLAPRPQDAAAPVQHTEGPVPFTPEALAAHLASGAPAFVSFTADWCLTCKVNERRVLADPRVTAALESAGVTHFRADWTRRDETIRAALARLGRAGVPAYALYTPDAPDTPRVLPELLSVDLVVSAMEQLAEPQPAVTSAESPPPRAGPPRARAHRAASD